MSLSLHADASEKMLQRLPCAVLVAIVFNYRPYHAVGCLEKNMSIQFIHNESSHARF